MDLLQSPQQPRLLSIKQTMFLLGIGRTSAYELIAIGKLKTVRIGRRRFVPIEAVDAFVKSLPE
jgi:excisionase family DNA binding protein